MTNNLPAIVGHRASINFLLTPCWYLANSENWIEFFHVTRDLWVGKFELSLLFNLSIPLHVNVVYSCPLKGIFTKNLRITQVEKQRCRKQLRNMLSNQTKMLRETVMSHLVLQFQTQLCFERFVNMSCGKFHLRR